MDSRLAWRVRLGARRRGGRARGGSAGSGGKDWLGRKGLARAERTGSGGKEGRGMAVSRTPRGRWVEEGLRALGDGGLDAVRIEPLAQAIGVTKGGFYWHFADRGALLNEVLDAWERANLDDVIEAVERGGGDARMRLRRLFALAFAGTGALRTDLAVREWARRDPAVAQRGRRVDNRRRED